MQVHCLPSNLFQAASCLGSTETYFNGGPSTFGETVDLCIGRVTANMSSDNPSSLLKGTAFEPNAILRGAQLTFVGAYRALQNPALFTSEHYRQAALAVAAGIAIRLLLAIPVSQMPSEEDHHSISNTSMPDPRHNNLPQFHPSLPIPGRWISRRMGRRHYRGYPLRRTPRLADTFLPDDLHALPIASNGPYVHGLSRLG